MGYRHVVLFRIRDGVPGAAVNKAVDALEALAELPGLLEWTVRRSDDQRKGRIIVENALFEHQEALAAFRIHPAHQEATERLSGIADWWIGDYDEPLKPE